MCSGVVGMVLRRPLQTLHCTAPLQQQHRDVASLLCNIAIKLFILTRTVMDCIELRQKVIDTSVMQC